MNALRSSVFNVQSLDIWFLIYNSTITRPTPDVVAVVRIGFINDKCANLLIQYTCHFCCQIWIHTIYFSFLAPVKKLWIGSKSFLQRKYFLRDLNRRKKTVSALFDTQQDALKINKRFSHTIRQDKWLYMTRAQSTSIMSQSGPEWRHLMTLSICYSFKKICVLRYRSCPGT